MGHAAYNRGVEFGNFCKFVGVVGFGKDGFGKVLAHLRGVHVDADGKLDIADVVISQLRVHDAGNDFVLFGVFIELHPLDQ